MKTYKTADMQRQGKVILDSAKSDGQIRIVRGKDIFVLSYEPQESTDSEDIESGTIPRDVAPGILEEMLQVQQDILAELRKGTQAVRTPEAKQVVTETTCLPPEPEEPQEPPKVVIPQQVQDAPLEPREPTPEDLSYALNFYGLEPVPDGTYRLTERGVQNAEGTAKTMVRNGNEEALRISRLPLEDPQRDLFLLVLQLDKYEAAIAKCRTGESNWILGAPTR